MSTAADTKTVPLDPGAGVLDTGPLAVLELAEQGLPQRTIADRLHISQATVYRRIREAVETRQAQRRAILINAMLAYLTLLATVATIALAALAWG
jgi:DNA-binding NarL/FixJ family response regulator